MTIGTCTCASGYNFGQELIATCNFACPSSWFKLGSAEQKGSSWCLRSEWMLDGSARQGSRTEPFWPAASRDRHDVIRRALASIGPGNRNTPSHQEIVLHGRQTFVATGMYSVDQAEYLPLSQYTMDVVIKPNRNCLLPPLSIWSQLHCTETEQQPTFCFLV